MCLAICVGTLIATWLNIYQDKAAKKRNKLPPTPENRLYFSCIESTLLAIGLFMFGWTCFSSIHWIVPCIGLAIASMGIFSIYLACFNYLADAYCTQASTALAAQSFCKSNAPSSDSECPPDFLTLTPSKVETCLRAPSRCSQIRCSKA